MTRMGGHCADLSCDFDGVMSLSYTVWSRGRLLGSTDLGYRYKPHRSRMGDFVPTELGGKLMPIATGLSPAVMQLARVSRAMDHPYSNDPALGEEQLEQLRRTTEYADYAAAEAQCEALDLELRGPDGSVITTEWIGIRDMQFPVSLDDDLFGDDWSSEDCDEFDPEREAALEKAIEADRALLDEIHKGLDDQPDWDEPPDADLPRYQIHVRLIDNKSVP